APVPYGAAPGRPVAGGWIGVGGAPQLAGPDGTASAAAPLTQQQLDATVTAALARLQAAGLSPSTLALLGSARYQVGRLPGALLGLYSDGTITVDAGAAGQGWFVDPTPARDEEFAGGATLFAPAGVSSQGAGCFNDLQHLAIAGGTSWRNHVPSGLESYSWSGSSCWSPPGPGPATCGPAPTAGETAAPCWSRPPPHPAVPPS